MSQLKHSRNRLQDHDLKQGEYKRMKKTYKRYARRKWTKNKSTIIGMDQLEERSQRQSKRQKQETSKKHINKEQTQAILFCFFVACEGTVNYYLQPGVSRKHHKDSDFYRSPHH